MKHVVAKGEVMTSLIGQSIDRYHILEQLGEGGMAVVYKAYDTHLDCSVAVKVILPSYEHTDKFLKRFEREARALAKLSHPNIVGVIDYGQRDGLPYLVMEYLPGGTLKQKLGQSMSWQEAARLIAPIARALAYAHQQGILHRDVKPSNILITQSGEPMLSDFGLAKILEAQETVDLTGSMGVVGTPEYMAPEQITGNEVDRRADIYALGVVFYELVTGRTPYRADTPAAVMIKAATEALPRPTLFIPGLPGNVEQVILKAVEKDPGNRYQSMDEFAQVLERFAADREPFEHTQDRPAPVKMAPTVIATPPSFPVSPPPATAAPTAGTGQRSAPPSKPVVSAPVQPPKKKVGWLGWVIGGGGLLAVGLVVLVVILIVVYYLMTGFNNANQTTTSIAPTAIPTQVPTLVSATILFQDNFSNSNSGWSLLSDQDAIVEYVNGGLRIYVITTNMDVWSHSHQTLPGDVSIEVDATKTSGPDDNDLGLICRYQTGGDFYVAVISSDGYQGISLHQNGSHKLLSGDKLTFTDAIHQGAAANHIRFDCVGNTLTLYVNDIQLSTVTDTTLSTGGDVGLIAGTYATGGTDILFKNFVVHQP
jgi:serine/threonine protein kinase